VLCRDGFCPFDSGWAEDAELCGVAGVAIVEVDETPLADALATGDCVFCAAAFGDVAPCACASNWYARLVNAVGLKSLVTVANWSICWISAELSPSAASALLSVSSSVCWVTLLEVDAAESGVDVAFEVFVAEDADAACDVGAFCALAPDPPVPLDVPFDERELVLLPAWELLDEFEGAAISAVLFVVVCALDEVEVDGSAEVFGALNSPAACAVDADDTVWDEGVKLSCGKAEVGVATSREVPAALLDDEVCTCWVDCWLSGPAFKLAMLERDMIHLHVAAKPERKCATGAQLASFNTRMVKGKNEATQRQSFYSGHRHAKEKL
jgi:hypothetical protein